ncbi:hypothetical protein [Mesorhizobium sp. CAU 1741]|uniref:hypothetical protein n=1 Tax=Mesorhizobium sp. CAU 1741 TaxID=3140366 RepID=UPI00325A4FF4
MSAPIAIFGYNRPAHLKAMLGSLFRCRGIDDAPLVIFSDGPRGDQDRGAVQAVRAILAELPRGRVELVLAEQNKGLKQSICDGVSAVTARYGRAIVLEDDLILSPAALDYFNAALDRYASEPRVWSVSGYVHDVPALSHRDRAFFLPFAQPWGWATWDRAWCRFDPQKPVPDALLASPAFRQAFSANGISDYATMLKMARDGQISSWFVRWYFAMFSEGGLSLFPPATLVGNRGVSGGSGSHGGRFNPYDLLVKPILPCDRTFQLPDEVAVDFQALDAIPRCWEASVLRFNHRAGAIKRRVLRTRAR